MKDLGVRCAKCGRYYDKTNALCPSCKGAIADKVICNMNSRTPVVELTALIYQWPRVGGVPITSKN